MRKAAEQGLASAQHNLAKMYYAGEGVLQDKVLAESWYLKAAEKGEVFAQFNVGNMYYLGDGVKQDKTKAAFWMQKAAEQGDAQAQYNFGVMYLNGEGVKTDAAAATFWIQKAAEQGHIKAKMTLNAVVSKEQWLASMRTVLPAALCKDGGFFRECFNESATVCHKTVTAANDSCLRQLDSEIPVQLHQPQDGSNWGGKVGVCAATVAAGTLAKSRIHNDKCDNPSLWQ